MRDTGWHTVLLLASAAVVGGCGGATASGGGSSTTIVTVDPPAFLEEVGAEASTVLRRPTLSVDELDAARREARGPERRAGMRDLAVALMFEAEASEGREERRARRRMDQMLDAARRGSRNAQLNAEVDFVRLWSAWRSGARNAGRLAERFTARHRQDGGELTALAWMIRGEVAFVEDEFDDAIDAYRFALGRLESPLYAFALLRTAHAHRRRGNAEEASQALSEVTRLGCEDDVPALTLRASLAAASEDGVGTREDPDGSTRPASCPEPSAEPADEEQGWRPSE